ncbi:hypothetical protein ACN38_g11726 [Penicillium nordicum]|uniref:Uncharacterized protein n=1 Tax=Penicillium nordicum TaxID=229535 RepID=A0A0M9WAK4_9EURO|nr:hypothetical protein ACN38_g11726 [Penicillium nordicum]
MGYGTIDIFVCLLWLLFGSTYEVDTLCHYIFHLFSSDIDPFSLSLSFFSFFLLVADSYPLSLRLFYDLYALCLCITYGTWII